MQQFRLRVETRNLFMELRELRDEVWLFIEGELLYIRATFGAEKINKA